MWEEMLAPWSDSNRKDWLSGGGVCKELLDLEWHYHTVRGIIYWGSKHKQGCCEERLGVHGKEMVVCG
jgi:hypothetical protein